MKRVVLEKKVLERNDATARRIRELLASKGIFSLNFMSSPGAGKTTVIERTITGLKEAGVKISFIDGDLDTDRDAERIKALGVDVVQINTSGACHLDADMVYRALEQVSLDCDMLIVENVGNLVCPATFDIGTSKNVVILSVPEGDDKVKKYPVMFSVADVVLINKIDLIGVVDFDMDRVEGEIRDVNPRVDLFKVSAKNGQGMEDWLNYLKGLIKISSGGVLMSIRNRSKMLIVFLLIFNILVWTLFLLATHLSPAMLSLGALAYFFGLRHAFDADHIAAIDNVTRKLRQDGKKHVGVGLFFSLGHSSVVLIMSVIVVMVVRSFSPTIKTAQNIGGVFGTVVSAGFLTIIGVINLFILKDLYRIFKDYRTTGRIESSAEFSAENLLNKRGLMGRFFGFMYKKIDSSWKMYPVGFLFGLGFDTATEIAILGISAAMAKNSQLPLWGVILFPLLFTAGMSLMDSLDGLVMMKIYDWAMVDAIRKIFFNMVITATSVFVALAIGTIEWIQVISLKLNSTSPILEFINNLNFEVLGVGVVAIMIASWVYAFVYYRRYVVAGSVTDRG